MKRFLAFVSIAWVFAGCQDLGVNPPGDVTIWLTYRSGFSGDSVFVTFDQKVSVKGVGYSDSLAMPGGWIFRSYVGHHSFSLELPAYQTRADIAFVTVADHVTLIDVDFDRAHRRLTYTITHMKLW